MTLLHRPSTRCSRPRTCGSPPIGAQARARCCSGIKALKGLRGSACRSASHVRTRGSRSESAMCQARVWGPPSGGGGGAVAFGSELS
ncbi:MAG: hypothetical protein WDW36_005596 [Sanguina aurantia]